MQKKNVDAVTETEIDLLSERFSIIPTEIEFVNKVVTWLKNSKVWDGELQRFPNLIATTGHKFSFEGRMESIIEIEELFQERYEKKDNKDRNCHPIGIIGATSGLGKTRLLLEIPKRCKYLTIENTIAVVTSYNNGNPPLFRNVPATQMFGLRIIYHFFFGNAPFTFRDFVDTIFPSEYFEIMTIPLAIRVLRKLHLDRTEIKPDMTLIYIGIDEFNYLVANNKKAHLHDLVVALSEVICSPPPNTFIFPIFAGTTLEPLAEVFRKSSHNVRNISISLLSRNDMNLILDALQRDNNRWKNWEQSWEFNILLQDLGGIPRCFEQFIIQCETFLAAESLSIRRLPFSRIFEFMLDYVQTNYYHALPIITAQKIIEDGVLQTEVGRNDILPNIDDGIITYGSLEESGGVILLTNKNKLTVYLPYLMLGALVSKAGMAKDFPAIESLRQVFDTMGSKFKETYWQTFEDFVVYFEAAREMLLYSHM